MTEIYLLPEEWDFLVSPFIWSKEGMPILDMQTAEELDPDYAGVTMEVGFFDAD